MEIANSIDVKSFLKLDIDERKSEANEVFKWIIVAMYGEPENKYYWPNFKVSHRLYRSKPSRKTREQTWWRDWEKSTRSMPKKNKGSKPPNFWNSIRPSGRLPSSKNSRNRSKPSTESQNCSTARHRRGEKSKTSTKRSKKAGLHS